MEHNETVYSTTNPAKNETGSYEFFVSTNDQLFMRSAEALRMLQSIAHSLNGTIFIYRPNTVKVRGNKNRQDIITMWFDIAVYLESLGYVPDYLLINKD